MLLAFHSLSGTYCSLTNCYMFIVGYEVAQANTAYVIRAKLTPSLLTGESVAATSSLYSSSVMDDAVYYTAAHQRKQDVLAAATESATCNPDKQCDPSTTITTVVVPSTTADEPSVPNGVSSGRLLYRQYTLSAYHGNKDSMLELGNCHFKGSCGLTKKDFDKVSHMASVLHCLALVLIAQI